jgi:uroporphyrinogen-III synthase
MFDLALFASPSAVRRFVEIAEAPREILARIGAVSIGPTTAAALRDAGASRVAEAVRPDEGGLWDALRIAWRRRPHERGSTP